MGPIALFDKSFLQTLSTDESVWFDHFFYPVISPVFFVETLADLEKRPREGKTAEEEVAIIAAKTPQMSGAPCFFHPGMCISDLFGNHPPMDGRIPMAGMRTVARNGKVAAIKDEAEETQAFSRWQRGRFLEMERVHARQWRARLASIDLTSIEKAMKAAGVNSKTCKDLVSAVKIADIAVKGLSKSVGRFDGMLEVLQVPQNQRRAIKDRWNRLKRPALDLFAPYAAHVLKVEIFFRVALGANLIASTRASHQVDIAYLFYLPFCQIFISNDKLHRLCAPLFMRSNQTFVWGVELKSDLSEINAIYSKLPSEIKASGVFKFAKRLPMESRGIVRNLFERYAPNLLKAPIDENLDPDKQHKLVEEIKGWETAAEVAPDTVKRDDDYNSMIFMRSVARQRGSWVQVPLDEQPEPQGGHATAENV
jgi:hypothetical protein